MVSHDSVLTFDLAVMFVIVVFIGNFVFLLNNTSFHTSEFQKLGINETQGMDVVNFVTSKASLSSAFNERESTHLADVRNLFSILKQIYYLTLLGLIITTVYLLVKKKTIPLIHNSLIISGTFSLIFLALLFLISFSFTSFFNNIHRPFFEANSWLFPSTSLLINLFPEQFFSDFTRRLFILIFVNSAVFFTAGLFMRKKFKQ
jgi:integral membrane protein (TIGR01906 family)